MNDLIKYDDDKVRMDLVVPEFVEGLARVLTFGAKKYAPNNWKKNPEWYRYFAALMRHMWAWWKGEDLDPETGESHLYHAACCLMFLAWCWENKVGTDNRIKY